MHDTAYEHGRLFFELYGSEIIRTVVELGSQDVNGSVRDHCPPGTHYIGLDVMPAKGVDVVVNPNAFLPLASNAADAIVTTSVFEHDVCFWDTFLELTRILRPGGLLYVNAPANGDFHRYPLDCWRFYPDAGVALVQWAGRRGIEIELIESFIGLPQAERWADFVAVFRKAGGAALMDKGCISDHAPAINIHRREQPAGAPLGVETASMPDRLIAEDLRTELAATKRTNAALSADLSTERQSNQYLSVDLARISTDLHTASANLVGAQQRNVLLSNELIAERDAVAALGVHLAMAEQRISDRDNAVAHAARDLAAMRNSTSWRLTAWLRWLTDAVRAERPTR